uniref:ERCC4 domain-containing protein n=1 Tax=viral metagenome TaxID=1070528 RepID=A0A6C0E272_9ZZZZ
MNRIMIKIDNRENELLKKIEHEKNTNELFKNLTVVIETLPLGDIILCNTETNEELIIIERKTLNDLSASIKDGRYEEQSYRLNGIDHPNHNIVYLIEGSIQNTCSLIKYKWDKQTVYSAIVSIAFYKGFSVMRSIDLNETAYMICNMAHKIEKTTNRSFYYSKPSQSINNNDVNQEPEVDIQIQQQQTKAYHDVVKRVKKDNVTKENIGQIILCQIPGVSSQSACAILNKFSNIRSLIKELETNPECLNDIYLTDAKGKQRKINKTCIQNIINLLINL